MTAREVKYDLDIELANQLLGCHWLSKGLEIEYSESRDQEVDQITEIIEKTSKRKHSWHLEQL
jgi:hypothetical protein